MSRYKTTFISVITLLIIGSQTQIQAQADTLDKSCVYDEASMLALSQQAFDQDMNSG